MIVVDASVLATALADDRADGERARDAIAHERLMAPELIDLEVLSVWRRATRARRLSLARARQGVSDLAALPLRRVPAHMLLPRVWELRDNLSAYDAAYVALADVLDAPLLTADERIARAPALPCTVTLVR